MFPTCADAAVVLGKSKIKFSQFKAQLETIALKEHENHLADFNELLSQIDTDNDG